MSDEYRRFQFPWNVYAHLAHLEDGGAAESAQPPIAELIPSSLASAPCRVLQVGVGLGGTLRTLAAQGHTVTGISPDPRRCAVVQARLDGRGRVVCVIFDEDDAPDGSFDVLLFHESLHRLDPLECFHRAFRLLDDGGHLIALGDVGLRRDRPALEPLPLVDHLAAQAERCGFQLTERDDHSERATSTVEHRRQMLARHRTAVLTDLGVSERQIAQLERSLAERAQRYREARDGYLRLIFEKDEAPRWRITAMRPEDAPAIRALYEEVFGHAMSQSFWEWKYADGRGEAILAWRYGKLVGHYGGLARDIRFKGEPVRAVAPCDVMVLPAERGGRRGVFFLTAVTFVERFVGNGSPYWLAFGFPNARHGEVGAALGIYSERLERMMEVSWSPRLLGLSLRETVSRIGPEDALDELDALWERMQDDLAGSIVGVRDSPYLRHRYFQHPAFHYDVYLVSRRFGEPLGLFVLNPDGKQCWLMDLVGPLAHLPSLIAHARRMTGRLGKRKLTMWITERYADQVAQTGGQVRALDVHIRSTIWTGGPDVASLRKAWWLTAGDTDFI